jgi:hypothetical protein
VGGPSFGPAVLEYTEHLESQGMMPNTDGDDPGRLDDVARAFSRPLPRWVALCFAGVFVGILALVPTENKAEPPVVALTVSVPVDDMQRLQVSYARMAAEIDELQKALRILGARAEICTATWGGWNER